MTLEGLLFLLSGYVSDRVTRTGSEQGLYTRTCLEHEVALTIENTIGSGESWDTSVKVSRRSFESEIVIGGVSLGSGTIPE